MAINKLLNGARKVRKWCPTCYEMAPDKLENGVQCCFNKFDLEPWPERFEQEGFAVLREGLTL